MHGIFRTESRPPIATEKDLLVAAKKKLFQLATFTQAIESQLN